MSKYNSDLPTATLNDAGLAVTAGWLTVYNIEPVQREYQQAVLEYLPEGVGLPALSFKDKPTLPNKAGLALVRSIDGTAWETLPDYRGQTAYNTATGEPQTVAVIGDLPRDVTLEVPSTLFDKWDGKKWVTDTREQQQAAVDAVQQELMLRQQKAERAIAPLETAVKLGMATEGEKTALTAWETYSVLLNRVDTTTAPNVVWPQSPDA
ncbi:Caudovirales tail fibre assembly protein [Serratia quinivorans]|uniref:tail fiber assembly protein n=1 Tax=Serratia quinivorans TaxID=137545 RepID=UPI00217989A4|nr:tail fiber assembly protein [Serratia quinivorans]CAI1127339.1 Caudovirales tail fibre assembly protein [Serratia quinivorans]CAI1196674.1 Caudovirales tail fibre assembly protein [Serratia quinivorans]CAI1960994.1 Caudovirales tail fibre assembly protein [Serratia quinivorans]CAI2154071.1 Caudovirales tail fibre assembly protein [Serratia quinivorans]CAI2496626.1 Caudovirales tail fibre assembly protein [Serratia quinivorans]